MKEELRVIIGRRLRALRSEQNMARERFAQEVGISAQFLAELENGKKGMSVETLYKICTRFHVSTDYMVMGKVDTVPSSPISGLLADMPNQYVEEYVNILKSVNKLVNESKES